MRSILRAIRREPLQVLAMIVSLSVGLGAGTAVFAFLDHIWLAPLPYTAADSIVLIWERWAEKPQDVSLGLSHPHYRALLEHSQSLDGVALYSSYEDFEVSNRAVTVKTSLATVTPQFFPLLGVRQMQGRWLSATLSENPLREAVVSQALWRRLFPGQELADQSVQIQGDDYPVVGIMPDRFAFPGRPTQIWVPKPPPPVEEAANRYSSCLAKRRAGATNSQVAAEVGRFFDSGSVRVASLWDGIYGNLRGPLQWLSAAIGMVLLTALLNAATIQFARISRRWKDFGIRAALGAGSRQLAAGLLLESLLLAAAGAALGFLVFSGIFVLVTKSWPGEIPGIHEFSLWAPRPLILLGFEVLLCALLLGCLSLWFVRRLRLVDSLAMGQQAAPVSGFRVRLNGAAVSVQLAFSVVLLIAAGMLTRSFIDAIRLDLGYEPDGVLAARFELPEERYPNREQQRQAVDLIIERLMQVEGAAAAAFSSSLPLRPHRGITTVHFPSLDLAPQVAFAQVSPGFFKALGLRIVAGGPFPERTTEEPALVVTESLAKTYLGQDPVGSIVYLGVNRPYRVSGVVDDVVQDGFLGQPEPGLYFHYLQPPTASFLHDLNNGYLTVRLAGRPSDYSPTLQAVVKAVDEEILVEWVRPLDEILAEKVAQPRFWTLLAASLSILALLFSTIALYAMMSYNVSQRIPELAVRMTLGATPAEIKRTVLRGAIAIIARGLIAGVLISLLVSALFADLLFGAARLQALTWVICLSFLAAATVLAAYLPARRGAETEPSFCLRST